MKGRAGPRLIKEQLQVWNGQVAPSTLTGSRGRGGSLQYKPEQKKSEFLIPFAPSEQCLNKEGTGTIPKNLSPGIL